MNSHAVRTLYPRTSIVAQGLSNRQEKPHGASHQWQRGIDVDMDFLHRIAVARGLLVILLDRVCRFVVHGFSD
jgi:hypothetical protein